MRSGLMACYECSHKAASTQWSPVLKCSIVHGAMCNVQCSACNAAVPKGPAFLFLKLLVPEQLSRGGRNGVMSQKVAGGK